MAKSCYVLCVLIKKLKTETNMKWHQTQTDKDSAAISSGNIQNSTSQQNHTVHAHAPPSVSVIY